MSEARELPRWAWLLSAAGIFVLIVTVRAPTDYLIALGVQVGSLLALAAPVFLVERAFERRVRQATDDVAATVADAVVEEGHQDSARRVPAQVHREYKDLARFMKERGWTMSAGRTHHDVWRKGRDAIVVARTPRDPANYYAMTQERVERGGGGLTYVP